MNDFSIDQPAQVQPPTNHVQGIPENAPIVSFDARLGEQYENIDFDYAAFEAEANRLNLPKEARAELSVHFGSGAGGTYDPKKHKLEVGMQQEPSRILSHEMQHAADDANGIKVYGGARSWADRGSKAGIVLGLPLAFADATGALITNSELLNDARVGFIPVLGALAIGHVWGYWLNPTERKARHSEKTSAVTMVTKQSRNKL